MTDQLAVQRHASDATILCVEDAPDVLPVMELFLRGEGFEVLAADTAEAALLQIRERAPEFVLTDYMLPGMSGLDLCRYLRARPQTRRIPIILHTAP
jgi:two-component system, OmpR family, phosphate regulon response regulator PhoB